MSDSSDRGERAAKPSVGRKGTTRGSVYTSFDLHPCRLEASSAMSISRVMERHTVPLPVTGDDAMISTDVRFRGVVRFTADEHCHGCQIAEKPRKRPERPVLSNLAIIPYGKILHHLVVI